MNIEDRIRQDPFLSVAINTTGISNREIGRQFNIDESVVRRWRNRNIVSPQTANHKPLTQEAGTSQWVAGIDLSTDRGEARTLPVPVVDGAKPVEDKELLEKVGVDPAKWEIASRKESRWQNAGGEWLSAHKVEVRRRGSMTGDLSVEQMTEILSEYDKRASWHSVSGSATHANGIFVVPISDLQAGKVDGGGTAALVDRFGRMIQAVRDRLIREGSAQTLIIPVLGDCIEGLVSQGGKLVTRLDISVTEQVRVYRRLLIHAVAELSPHAKRVLVVVLPGNHDETYRVVSTPTHDSCTRTARSWWSRSTWAPRTSRSCSRSRTGTWPRPRTPWQHGGPGSHSDASTEEAPTFCSRGTSITCAPSRWAGDGPGFRYRPWTAAPTGTAARLGPTRLRVSCPCGSPPERAWAGKV
jgi:hypothetical protein